MGALIHILHQKFCRAKSGWLVLLFVLPCFLIPGLDVQAATYYSRASANFATNSTWSTSSGGGAYGGTFTAADIFIVESPNNVTIAANQSAASVTVQSGATITMNGNFTLTVPTITVNSGGTVALGTRTLTFTGTFTNGGTITGTSGRLNFTTNNFINNGLINITTTGGFVKTTGTFTNSATGQIIIGGAGIITMGTGDFVNNNTSANADFGSSVVTITGTDAAQSIGGFVTDARLSCTKTAGTVTLTGDVTCIGITMNGSGGTMNLGAGLNHTTTGTVILTAGTLNGGSSTLNVNIVSTTAWQGTATVFTPGTGTVNFGAAGNQTMSSTGTETFYNLTYSNSGTKTNATYTVNNIFSLEGTAVFSAIPTYGSGAGLRYASTTRTAGTEWTNTFVATNGVTIDNGATITMAVNKTFNANVPLTINAGGTLTTGNFDFIFNGNFINSGTWTASTGDVTVTGTATQSIGGFTTTGLFSLTKASGTATMTGNANAGSFTLNAAAGILNLGAFTHTIAGTYTNTAGTVNANTSVLNLGGDVVSTAGAFNPNTGTVNFTGASAQAIPGVNWYNLGFSGAGLKTMTANSGAQNVMTIDPGATVDMAGFVFTFSGAGTPFVNNGTFIASTSTVNYSNAASTFITAVNYYSLNGTGGDRTFSTLANIGIAGVFTPGAGAYTVPGSTVDFNGTADQNIPAFTFDKLIVSNAGIKKILAAVVVACQTIDINDAASVEIDADGAGKLNVLQ